MFFIGQIAYLKSIRRVTRTVKGGTMLFTQYITVGLSTAMLVFSILRYHLRPSRTSLRIPIWILGLHVLAFYVYVFLNNRDFFVEGSFFEVLESRRWSSLLMLQSMFTHCSLEFYGYIRDREAWKNGKYGQ